MKQMPSVYTASQIRNWDVDTQTSNGWIPARPVVYISRTCFQRLKLAWNVFTGKYDALDWEEA